MRFVCVVVLLAGTVGPAEVFVADQQRSAGGLKGTKPPEQPLADIPEAFRFLFHSPEQFTREVAKRPTHVAYVEELWKGLPYDSISLERGGTAGCPPGVCSTVTFYRGTVSGIRRAASCLKAPCPPGELLGRAELQTVTDAGVSNTLAGLLAPPPATNELEPSLEPFPQGQQRPGPRISDFEGSIGVQTFANLSYLLHRARFLDLPNEYACLSCSPHRFYSMLSVAAGGKTKTVIDYGVGRPVELWAIQQAFDSVSKSIQWTQR